MISNLIFFVSIFSIGLTSSASCLNGLNFSAPETGKIVQGFSPRQFELFSRYAVFLGHALFLKQNEILASDQNIEMSPSEFTTYAAITHALENTKLKDGTSALLLVTRVDRILGENPQLPSPLQYNLHVEWRPDAIQRFREIGFDRRPGWGHHSMYGLSYNRNSYGLHVLFEKGTIHGEVHVDYRSAKFNRAGPDHFEGHFQAINADVRAVGPEKDPVTHLPIVNLERHCQWFGMIPGFL